jgi:hypothetical protein
VSAAAVPHRDRSRRNVGALMMSNQTLKLWLI